MDEDRNRERLMSAWSATPSPEEVDRVRRAAAAARRLRRVQQTMLGVLTAAVVTDQFAPVHWGLEPLARGVSLGAILVWIVLSFLEARQSAMSGTSSDAALGQVARALRDERERELRWWVGGWSWGAWIAGTALVVALLSGPARMMPRGGHVALLALVAVGVLVMAAVRYLRELKISTDLTRLDALIAGMEERAPDPPRIPRRGVRAGLRLLELGVACWAGITAVRGPDALAVNARDLMNAVHSNAQWAQRLGLPHGGNSLPVAGDPVERYCAARARLAPALAAFADAEAHVTEALAIELEERVSVGARHDVRWQEHALAWEEARSTLLMAADRALRSQGLRPADLRETGAQVESHEASAAFRLPSGQARAIVAARLRVQALESIVADPMRSAIHGQANAELAPARETLARLATQAGSPPVPAGAPCGTESLAGLDWLTVLDAQPPPWNEALR